MTDITVGHGYCLRHGHHDGPDGICPDCAAEQILASFDKEQAREIARTATQASEYCRSLEDRVRRLEETLRWIGDEASKILDEEQTNDQNT